LIRLQLRRLQRSSRDSSHENTGEPAPALFFFGGEKGPVSTGPGRPSATPAHQPVHPVQGEQRYDQKRHRKPEPDAPDHAAGRPARLEDHLAAPVGDEEKDKEKEQVANGKAAGIDKYLP